MALKREQEERERVEQERREAEERRLQRLQELRATIERKRKEAEQKEREEKARVERAQRLERQKQEKERKKREKEERERIARETAERERIARENAERERRELEERQREEAERKRREKEEREKAAREKAQRERLQREAAATLQLVVGGSNLVTFGAGFETRNLVPGFNLCAVVVRNLPNNTRRDQVARIFAQDLELDTSRFHVADMKYENGSQKAVVLTRLDDSQAIEAQVLEGIECNGQLLEFEMGANALWGKMNSSSTAQDTNTLTIHFNKPSKSMVVTYTSMEEAQRKVRELDRKVVSGRNIRAAMNVQPTGSAARFTFVPSSVKVTNLDPSIMATDLAAVADSYDIREIKSSLYDFDSAVRLLEARLRGYRMVNGSFQTIIDGIKVQAKAQFDSYDNAQRAYNAIEQGIFGRNPWYRPVLPRGHEYVISIIRRQYDAQKELWEEMTEGSSKRDGAFIRINESTKNGRMYIKVLGGNQKNVGALKVRVESLVVGERLGSDHWHSSFLNSGSATFLDSVRTETGAFVSVDRKVFALRLFGTNNSNPEAKKMIEEEVERLNFSEWSIPLQRQSVSFFVRFGLKAMQEALGEDNVSLDLSSRPITIKVKGGDDARHHLRKLMDEALEGKGIPVAEMRTGGAGDGAVCPICYDEVNVPDVLSCGHSYCEACLRHYLISAADSKKFPLVCMGNEATCDSPIAIPIIQRYLTPQRFNRLVDVVFHTYLDQNSRTFKYCTTPDCTQIYECNTGKTTHQCPSCFSKICAGCDEESHQGMGCEEARIHRNPAEQERLNDEWAARNNIKRCPSCRVMIEKTVGCNHITCRCGAHVCWRCLGVFAVDTIYTHMHTAHGGIHEPDPPPAPVLPRIVPRVVLQPAVHPFRVQPNPLVDVRLRQEQEDRRIAEALQRQEARQHQALRENNYAEYLEHRRQREAQDAVAMRERRLLREQEEQRRRDVAAEFARAQERVRQEQERRRQQEGGGWCTIM